MTSVYSNADEVDFSLMPLVAGNGGKALINAATDLAKDRGDFVVFATVSKDGQPIYNGPNALGDIKSFITTGLSASTYLYLSSSFKYRYDRYNDRNIWVPTSADMAGLCLS